MTNRDVNGAVHEAVDLAVYPTVGQAVLGAVYWPVCQAVLGAVYWPVYETMGRAVHGAVSRREAPPHLGLGLYLGGVA